MISRRLSDSQYGSGRKAIREAICDMESRLTRIETRTVGLREYLLTTLQATNISKGRMSVVYRVEKSKPATGCYRRRIAVPTEMRPSTRRRRHQTSAPLLTHRGRVSIAAHLSTLSGSKSNRKDSMKLFGIARLADVESATRRAATGCSFALAYDYGMKDETEKANAMVSASLWGEQAAPAAHLTKGTALFVTCAMCMLSLDTRPRADLVGTVADRVPAEAARQQHATANPAPRNRAAPKSSSFDDDDIPF